MRVVLHQALARLRDAEARARDQAAEIEDLRSQLAAVAASRKTEAPKPDLTADLERQLEEARRALYVQIRESVLVFFLIGCL